MDCVVRGGYMGVQYRVPNPEEASRRQEPLAASFWKASGTLGRCAARLRRAPPL